MTHATGFPPRALHLERGAHSLELTTCPPCCDNRGCGCPCQLTLRSSTWCLEPPGLTFLSELARAWAVFKGPSDTRLFNQIAPFPWDARLLSHTTSSSLVQLQQPFQPTADRPEPLSSESPVHLGPTPWRTVQRSPQAWWALRVGPCAITSITITMNMHSSCRQ